MKTVIGALALLLAAPVATQSAPQGGQPGPAQPQQHGQHHQQGQHGKHADCCKQVNGRMECQMMKGHGSQQQGQGQHQGHSGH